MTSTHDFFFLVLIWTTDSKRGPTNKVLAKGKKSMSPQWTSTPFVLYKTFHTGIEQIETKTRKYQHMLRELMLECVGRPWVQRNYVAWFQAVLFSIHWIQRTSHLKDSRLRTVHSTMTQSLSPEDASYSWQNFKPSIPYPLLTIKHVWLLIICISQVSRDFTACIPTLFLYGLPLSCVNSERMTESSNSLQKRLGKISLLRNTMMLRPRGKHDSNTKPRYISEGAVNEEKNTQSHKPRPRLKCPQRKVRGRKKGTKNRKKTLRTSSQSEKCDEKIKKDCNNDKRFPWVFWRNKLRALWGKELIYARKVMLRTSKEYVSRMSGGPALPKCDMAANKLSASGRCCYRWRPIARTRRGKTET
jgi:hypothetical protein